jgi:hypothetical protein
MVDHSRQIGTFGHGFTYGGHPLGCAVGVKAIEDLREARHRGHVRALSPLFAGGCKRFASIRWSARCAIAAWSARSSWSPTRRPSALRPEGGQVGAYLAPSASRPGARR